MRPIARFTLHAAAATALIAFAATSAAAVDHLKLLATVNMGATDASSGKEKWIEIQGWDFGTRQSTSRAGKKSGSVDYAWKVEEGEAASTGRSRSSMAGEHLSRSDAPPRGDHEEEMSIVAGQATSPPGGDAKYGAVSGVRRNDNLASRGKPAADVDGNGTVDALTDGLILVRNSATPPDRGAVRVKVKLPWLSCRVGARFPAAELAAGGKTYDLSGLTVAACGTDAIVLDYAKVKVRGWDPEKKREIVGTAR